MRRVEDAFEAALWSTRFVVLLGVLASVVASVALFYLAAADTVIMVGHLVPFADPSLDDAARRAIHDATIQHVVKIVDGYLLGTVLLIFGFGLYELFVSRIDRAAEAEARRGVLLIRSLDDLKSRLGKVVLMILVVSVFERILHVPVESPRDLVAVAASIALVAAALWLSHASDARHGP